MRILQTRDVLGVEFQRYLLETGAVTEWLHEYQAFDGQTQMGVYEDDEGGWYWVFEGWVNDDPDYSGHFMELASGHEKDESSALFKAARHMLRFYEIDHDVMNRMMELYEESERAAMLYEMQRDEWEIQPEVF
jgi:hypothetical protein